jgi:hypothetical protein
MRYEREDLCRVRGSKLRRVIREKYGKLMEFYALAAKMCQMSEHNIHMFLGCGRRSQKKYAHTILTMLGLKDEDFDDYFVGEESHSDALCPVSRSDGAAMIPLLHAIIDRLNGLDEKLDRLSHMVRIFNETREETREET